MKIVIATPLYPPDTAFQATYVKELATRLSKKHSVTIVTYGHLPELIENVHIRAVDKRYPLPVRLILFFILLFKSTWSAHVLYVQNGASVELPAVIVSMLLRRPLLLGISDAEAHERASHTKARTQMEKRVARRAVAIMRDFPSARPEILPFGSYPKEEMLRWDAVWQSHLAAVERAYTHA